MQARTQTPVQATDSAVEPAADRRAISAVAYGFMVCWTPSDERIRLTR